MTIAGNAARPLGAQSCGAVREDGPAAPQGDELSPAPSSAPPNLQGFSARRGWSQLFPKQKQTLSSTFQP